MGGKKDLDYLESERQKLWGEVVSHRNDLAMAQKSIAALKNEISTLTEAVVKKTSDYERDAKNSSAQVTRYKNKAIETLKEAEQSKSAVLQLFAQAQETSMLLSDANAKYKTIKAQDAEVSESCDKIASARESFLEMADDVEASLANARTKLTAASASADEVAVLESSIEAISKKVTLLHSQSAKRNGEISQLHNEVLGYTYEDEDTGEESSVVGLKEELDESYSELKKSVASFSEDLTEFKDRKIEEYKSFESAKSDEFEKIKTEIRGLLPEAMTAGLSHAYEEKRKAEEEEQVKAAVTFKRSIYALAAVSIIPIFVSLYSGLVDGKTLDEIIRNLPQIVLAITPLYTPVFWFAIVANKRIKLAKRLAEEYSHKEVLSKTFEGLSTQIESMDDSEVSRDLRIRLLYNIISVSSENPGKLISNYNKSDNPIFDALDKSISLSKSIEKIAAFPGVELILQKVVKKQEKIKAKIDDAVSDAASINDEADDDE